MFKLIFKFMVITVFLVILSVGLALWKGGEPFRYVGGKIMVAGKSIIKFGDFVDDSVSGGKKLRKNFDKFKDVITSEDEKGIGPKK